MRRITIAVALTVMSVAIPATAQTVTLFPLENQSHPSPGITLGPDGAMWFADSVNVDVGRIDGSGNVTSFALPNFAASGGITTGPDGNLWLTLDIERLCRLTPAGVVTLFSVPGFGGITTGPDGNIWFTEAGANRIGRITPQGVVTEYLIPVAFSFPESITVGPDGALWFAQGGGGIGRITTDGTITEIPIPFPSSPRWIAAGPDGNLWYTTPDGDPPLGNKVSRLTLGGQVTDYFVPTPRGAPLQIAAGPDGAMWFTEVHANKIGRITVDGEISELASPSSCATPFLGPFGCLPWAIARGTNSDLWFTDVLGISRIQLPAPTPCVWTSTQVCLNGSRFQVSVKWQVLDEGTSGAGHAVQLSADTGYFWFFTANNIELTVKVVDGRAVNNRFWVFGGALSNVAYTITVRDTQTGQVKTYTNPAGTLASFADTSTFPGS
jgi:virginiamycin B lyase